MLHWPQNTESHISSTGLRNRSRSSQTHTHTHTVRNGAHKTLLSHTNVTRSTTRTKQVAAISTRSYYSETVSTLGRPPQCYKCTVRQISKTLNSNGREISWTGPTSNTGKHHPSQTQYQITSSSTNTSTPARPVTLPHLLHLLRRERSQVFTSHQGVHLARPTPFKSSFSFIPPYIFPEADSKEVCTSDDSSK